MNIDETSSSSSDSTNEALAYVSVPITVCLMIMIRYLHEYKCIMHMEDFKTPSKLKMSHDFSFSYILFGAIIFRRWETKWDVLTGSYFCFISLSSIGFGDIIPGDGVTKLLHHP